MDNLNKLARQWAQGVKSNPMVWNTDRAHAAAEFILAHTKPESMDKVEWDDEKHQLAGAVTPGGVEVVMLDMLSEVVDGPRRVYVWDIEYASVERELPYNVTPNEKRYELREVSDHPATLSTLEDYENAPEGTCFIGHDGYPSIKESNKWHNPHYFNKPSRMMPDECGKVDVLRWGWGDEA